MDNLRFFFFKKRHSETLILLDFQNTVGFVRK